MYTREDWRKAVAAELAWTTPDGLLVEPLYTPEDSLGWPARAARGWMIRQDLDLPDPASFRAAAEEAVAGGVEVLGVRLDWPTRVAYGRSGEDGLAAVGRDDLLAAVGGLDVPLAVVGGVAGPLAASVLERVLYVELDLPEALMSGCRWEDLAGAQVLSWQSLFEAGATPVRELTWATAFTIEWLRRGLGAPAWSFAVSGQLLWELAKLRAARILLDNVCEAFSLTAGGLHVRTGRRDLTVADAPNNLLRQGLGALAGALAGAETIHVDPYTQPQGADSDSLRLARNQQHLLRHEGGLGQDAVAGAYAVEQLARQLASAAWSRVQELEKAGGAHQKGDQLEAELAQDRKEHVVTLVGVTRYAADGQRLVRPEPRPVHYRGAEADGRLEEGAELVKLCRCDGNIPPWRPQVRFEELAHQGAPA